MADMANKHYGNIGDIWKHLALAEILGLERPRAYWESHAGSASYPLTPAPERDYGIYRFMARAEASEGLRGSRFWMLLERLRAGAPGPAIYPGSPLVAMSELGPAASYLFCDTDGASLAAIGACARELRVPADGVRYVEGDGPAALLDAAARLPEAELARIVAVIDPFEIASDALGLFARLARAGAAVALWYGFDSPSARLKCRDSIGCALGGSPGDARATPGPGVWCGEVAVRGLARAYLSFDPGIRGCGLATAGFATEAIRAAEVLGRELCRVYAEGSPGDGALDFQAVAFSRLTRQGGRP
jgi:23S rRNA (adenine2030-N6)-methyltransferase